jgi:prolyl-tRNA editing enzyme YbaK/EbsC (Cys-tRNA(Pro) deacylase)
MAGDAKVDNKKYKNHYHLKASMIPGDRLEDLVGHIPGAVCPFAINEGVKVDLDISLKRFETVHTAGGSLNSTISLSPDELKQHIASANWVDVCKGWYADEAE